MKSETEVTTTESHSRISVPHCFDKFLTRLANRKMYMVMRALSKFRQINVRQISKMGSMV